MATPISREDLLMLRLANHFPAHPGGPTPGVVDTVARMLALQAQDFGQALWAIGSRVPGVTKTDILAVLDSAEVVRSWPMRGTLHLVLPDDLRWMLELTGERMLKSAARRLSELDLDQRTLQQAREVAVGELAGGVAMSRSEFLDTLSRAGISTGNQRGYHIIWYLAQTAVVCWGPPEGTQQSLVLLDEWAPESNRPDREEALRRYVLGYFTGHGPATLRDFTWWSKLTVADALVGLAAARSELTEYVHDGASYWAPSAAGNPEPADCAGLLLAGYDEYVLGYQDRSIALPYEYASRIMVSNNGVFRPSLVLNGRVVGTWRRSPGEHAPTVMLFPESGIGDSHAFDDAVEAYTRFTAS